MNSGMCSQRYGGGRTTKVDLVGNGALRRFETGISSRRKTTVYFSGGHDVQHSPSSEVA